MTRTHFVFQLQNVLLYYFRHTKNGFHLWYLTTDAHFVHRKLLRQKIEDTKVNSFSKWPLKHCKHQMKNKIVSRNDLWNTANSKRRPNLWIDWWFSFVFWCFHVWKEKSSLEMTSETLQTAKEDQLINWLMIFIRFLMFPSLERQMRWFLFYVLSFSENCSAFHFELLTFTPFFFCIIIIHAIASSTISFDIWYFPQFSVASCFHLEPYYLRNYSPQSVACKWRETLLSTNWNIEIGIFMCTFLTTNNENASRCQISIIKLNFSFKINSIVVCFLLLASIF